ncbi:MAG TPA: YncE family protein, partial [Gaiellaceae bacterium]|nr:YncE family protein [Gaiellaceae bacterium]
AIESGGDGPASIEVSAGSVWVANRNSNTVTRLDPQTNQVLASVPVGGMPGWHAVAPDETIFVPNNSDNTVSRIDPESNSVIQTIRVGAGPLVVRPAFGDLWLGHLRGSSVWRFRVARTT